MAAEARSRTADILSIYVPAFFIFLGMGIVSPILAIYAETFNVTYALVSLAISMYAIGRFMADIPVGVLADRFGRKPLMISGTIIIAISSFLNATAVEFWQFLIYRLLEGVGAAMWITSRSIHRQSSIQGGDDGFIGVWVMLVKIEMEQCFRQFPLQLSNRFWGYIGIIL